MTNRGTAKPAFSSVLPAASVALATEEVMEWPKSASLHVQHVVSYPLFSYYFLHNCQYQVFVHYFSLRRNPKREY